MKHTDTPWTVKVMSAKEGFVDILPTNDDCATPIAGLLHHDTIANAAFIVKAVNNHYSLLNVLKEIEKGMSSHAKELDKFGVIRAITQAEKE